MLAVSGGTMVMLSTPYGKRGEFYEAWRNGGDAWEKYKVTAHDVSRISEDFLADERRQLPAPIFRQEYGCSFEETDDQLFTEEMITGALDNEIEPLEELRGFTW
jgi:hypothetical protein